MKQINIDNNLKELNLRRNLENIALSNGFLPIDLPTMINKDIVVNKLGDTNKQVFELKNGDILIPEGTNVVVDWYKKTQNNKKDVKVFYFKRMFRKEKKQKGRYNEFWQFGIEWLNPTDKKAYQKMISLADQMTGNKFKIDYKVDRGADHYKNRKRFEVSTNELGSQKQIVEGGEYENGVGFAIGFERLLLTWK